MASITDYLEQYEKQKKAKSAPSESIGQLQAQSPFSLASAAKVNPMLEAQPNVLAQGQASAEPQVQMATPNLGTPMFEATESGRRFASGVGSIFDAGVSGAKSLMEAGGNFVNSTSDMAADLISQSTGGQVNLQSSPNVGQTSTTGVGAPITNADQLRQFMSGLNEQAAQTPSTEVTEPAVETPMAEPTVQAAAPQVQESAPVEPQLQPAPQAPTTGNVTTAGGQPLAEFLAGGQQLDAQGRMVDPEVDRSSFNQASADRETRQAARPDFGEAVSDRDRRAASGDGMSDADRRDIAKANQKGASAGDVARGDKVAGLAGIDRETGLPLTATKTKLTSTEEKAATIRDANPDLSDEEVAAIASGSVRVVQNPSTGETTLLNIATGVSKKVNRGKETELNFDVAAPEESLFSRAGKFTGAVEATKRKGQGLTGQFGIDIATDASIGAAQDFETAQNELVRAFRDSSRYSATEANQLKKELNIALSPFEDPKTAEAKLRSIDQSLARRYANEESTALDENTSLAKREDARSRARAIAEFRATLGVTEEVEGSGESEGGNVPDNIDAGDWEFMTEEQRKLFN